MALRLTGIARRTSGSAWATVTTAISAAMMVVVFFMFGFLVCCLKVVADFGRSPSGWVKRLTVVPFGSLYFCFQLLKLALDFALLLFLAHFAFAGFALQRRLELWP